MSNYDWTENQIKAAIGKGNRRSQEDWLGTDIFRVGNKRDPKGKKAEAQDYRNLMKMLVDRGLAFDNREIITSGDYKISFNLNAKERFFHQPETPRFFSEYFFNSFKYSPLLAEEKWFISNSDQKSLDCFEKVSLEWKVILDTLSVLDNTGHIELDPSYSQHIDKNAKDIILSTAKGFASLYKLLEIGWDELKADYPEFKSYDGLFKYILKDRAHADFEICRTPPKETIYADLKRIQSVLPLASFGESFIKELLGGFPQNMREIFGRDKLTDPLPDNGQIKPFDGDVGDINKKSRALFHKSPWHRESAALQISIVRILWKSSNPKVREAIWGFVSASVKNAYSAQRIFRRETDNRTRANESDK